MTKRETGNVHAIYTVFKILGGGGGEGVNCFVILKC